MKYKFNIFVFFIGILLFCSCSFNNPSPSTTPTSVINEKNNVSATSSSPQPKKESSSLCMGGVKLFIGMPKNDVLGMLEGNYKLMPETNYGSYTGNAVYEKQPYSSIGQVYFQDSKLCAVTKTWAESNNTDTTKFGNELYEVLSRLKDEGKMNAKINLRETKQPDSLNRVIELEFEGKQIFVSVNDFKVKNTRYKTASIDETIADEELRKKALQELTSTTSK